jgi:Amt family ammonium transporter
MLPWRDTLVYEALAKHLGVGFRYSEKQAREATSEGEKLGAAQAAKLPATLLEELRDAAILLDDRRCCQFVKRIDRVDGEFGARVRRMVNTFQYRELPAGLDPLVGSRAE